MRVQGRGEFAAVEAVAEGLRMGVEWLVRGGLNVLGLLFAFLFVFSLFLFLEGFGGNGW